MCKGTYLSHPATTFMILCKSCLSYYAMKSNATKVLAQTCNLTDLAKRLSHLATSESKSFVSVLNMNDTARGSAIGPLSDIYYIHLLVDLHKNYMYRVGLIA
jgi:hypothetical protein